MAAPRSPQSNGRLSSRFSLRSSSKSSKRKGVRFWFRSSSKAESDDSDDLAADAAAAARELDEEFEKPKEPTESTSSYVPRVEYGSPHCNEERDAPWTSNEQVEQHYAALGWAVVSIVKDGNCLFRAISDQLYTNELFHQDIRQRLVDFIQREEKLFQRLAFFVFRYTERFWYLERGFFAHLVQCPLAVCLRLLRALATSS